MFTIIGIGAFLGCCVLSTLPDAHKPEKDNEQVFTEPDKFSKEWVRNNLRKNAYDNWDCDDIAYKCKDNWYRQDVEKMMRRGWTFEEAVEELSKEGH